MDLTTNLHSVIKFFKWLIVHCYCNSTYTPWSILIKFLFYCEINWKSPSKNPDVGDVSGTQVGFRIASLNSKWDIGWEEIKKLLTRVFTRIYFRSLWPSCRFVFLFSLASAPVLYIVGLHSSFRSWVVDYFNFIFFSFLC